MRKLVLLVVTSIVAVLSPSAGWSEGTETLGPAQLAISGGSGIVVAGTGTQEGDEISVEVPAEAAVNQVILYWSGEHRPPAGDDSITINGIAVQGQLIGGPAFFFGGDVHTSSYRADVTDLGLVGPGTNSLVVTDMEFNFANAGAGVVVVVDDRSDVADIQIHDGMDNAFFGFKNDRQKTIPQTFTLEAKPFPRTADLALMVASVEGPDRPNHVLVTVEGQPTQTVTNPFSSANGPEWDTVTIPVAVPGGASTVTVELVSAEDDDGVVENPASMEWVMAALSVGTCPPLSDTPAQSAGSAYVIDGDVLGLIQINEVGNSASAAPGGPTDDAALVANLNVVGVAGGSLLTSQSSSSLDPSTTTSSSTLADLSLLGGRVTATTIRAVSQSTATTSAAGFSSAGSTIEGLRVNGQPVSVVPNTTLAVKGLFGITVAELHVFSDTGTSSVSGPTASASHSVDMLRLVMLRSALGLPAGATIVIGHAETSAQSPTGGCTSLARISGEAFTTSVSGTLGGVQLLDTKVGQAVLPPTGGSDSDGTAAGIGGAVTSSSAANTTVGSLEPNPGATSRSVVEGLSLLGGTVTADVLDVSSSSSAEGTVAATDFVATFANLRIGGSTVSSDVAPNTTFTVNLGGGTILSVVINGRSEVGNGTTDSEGTIAAIHARVFGPGGGLIAEIVVASAHSGAHT